MLEAGPVGAAVFASGSGTNFQALLDHEAHGSVWSTRLLISDREGAGALDRAREAGVETRVIRVSGRPSEEVGAETVAVLRKAGVGIVLLAGYLRLVPAAVIAEFRGRMLNVHPALLPSFGGKGMYGRRVHEAVIRSGARVSGPTVHLVDEEYDEGRILAQWPVPVLVDDTPDTLAERVLDAEHRLYPAVAEHLARAVAERRTAEPLDLDGERFTLE